MNKNEIDEQAEREAAALRKQGRRNNFNEYRTERQPKYGVVKFAGLFCNDLGVQGHR